MATGSKTKPLALATPFVFGDFGKPLALRRDDAKRRPAVAATVAAIVAPVAALRQIAETLAPVETPMPTQLAPPPGPSADVRKSLQTLASELKSLIQRDRQSRAGPRR